MKSIKRINQQKTIGSRAVIKAPSGTRGYLWLLSTGALTVSLALVGAEAHAEKRIVVTKIRGAEQGLQQSIETIISKEHQVIASWKYAMAARRLKAKKESERDIIRIAQRLSADGILIGTIDDGDDGYLLRLRLRDGNSGQTIEKISVRLRSPRLNRKMRRAVSKRLMPAIEQMEFLEAAESTDEQEVADEEAEIDSEPASTSSFSQREEAREELPMMTTRGTTVSRRHASMYLSAGLSMVDRSLTFTAREGIANPPAGYTGPATPGFRAAGELYPFAAGKKSGSMMGNLGVGFVVDQVFSLKTAVEGAMDVTLPTSHSHYGAIVKARYSLGDGVGSPWIVARVGYNRMVFAVDKNAAPEGLAVDTPNVAYTYYDPGLALTLPVSERLTVSVDGLIMLVADTGEIQTPEQYGAAKVTGLDAGLVVDYRVTAHTAVLLGGRYTRIGYEFAGEGARVRTEGSDPGSQDIGGALDRYIRGFVNLGYLF